MNGPFARATILALTTLGCIALAGCGNSDKLSRAQAQQVWRALVQQSDPSNPAAIMGAAESLTCAQGGLQNKRMGLLSVRGDNLQMRAALHYNGCTVGDTRFDGELFVGIRSGSAAKSGVSHYDGTLTGELILPGRTPVHCPVDLSSTRDPGNHQSVQYTGTFCGYDASVLKL